MDDIEMEYYLFKDIDFDSLKKNYKNEEYFKDFMTKYYDNISNYKRDTFFFRQLNRYKSSYKPIIDFLFEEITEKKGKDCDKIIEFDNKNYEKYIASEFNAFFLRNAIHQLFYSEYSGTNEEIFNKIYDKMIKIFPKLKENDHYIDYKLEKAKYDIINYDKTFKIINIINIFKKIIL